MNSERNVNLILSNWHWSHHSALSAGNNRSHLTIFYFTSVCNDDLKETSIDLITFIIDQIWWMLINCSCSISFLPAMSSGATAASAAYAGIFSSGSALDPTPGTSPAPGSCLKPRRAFRGPRSSWGPGSLTHCHFFYSQSIRSRRSRPSQWPQYPHLCELRIWPITFQRCLWLLPLRSTEGLVFFKGLVTRTSQLYVSKLFIRLLIWVWMVREPCSHYQTAANILNLF